ncbi:MAG: MmcQ/YjbR family DNA-binding protein [Muribaculaceae bacterium]|nr:MmcQ/YjbR family DNA-binding protein [Muribaculaceae bacterium]
MDIITVREYCLSLPMVTEDMPFGEGVLVFRIFNKIFACLSLDGDDYFAIKCDPDYAIELRDRYSEITPAYHWNKKYWNQVSLRSRLNFDLIKSLIRHSYSEVVAKLPKKLKTEYPEITQIKASSG